VPEVSLRVLKYLQSKIYIDYFYSKMGSKYYLRLHFIIQDDRMKSIYLINTLTLFKGRQPHRKRTIAIVQNYSCEEQIKMPVNLRCLTIWGPAVNIIEYYGKGILH
jgi:hypothetical protein